MHYELSGKAQVNFVYCVTGRMLDVSIDLRPSGQLGRVHVAEMTGGGKSALIIFDSLAHGFVVLKDNTTFLSMTPQQYSPKDKWGVDWDTINVDFGIERYVVTEKKLSWPLLVDVTQQGSEV
jgi:dTDP-4-dehydrorhamnose 3,5-epimerase-like enzyme